MIGITNNTSFPSITLATPLTVANGGTASSTAATALTALGVNTAVQYGAPTTGSTVTATGGSNAILLLDPAGTLVALTVNLPSSPTSGDRITISSTQIITTLTIGNGTIVGTLTTLALGGFARYMYNSTASKWLRIG